MTRVRRLRLTIEGRELDREQAATLVRDALAGTAGSLGSRTIEVRDPGDDRALATSLREAVVKERR
ncbi:MAG TPA: hypothetical protein VNO82_03775 [Solirubrobacteraceae bacterium]|nr:hypothetical protein [Solirubrobacteraceae bacterium]